MSLSIPVEVVENFIDQAQDDGALLRSLSLTCSDLLPRSRYHLFAWHIRLHSLQQLYSFYAYLDANADRKFLIRAMTMCVTKESSSLSILEVVPILLFTKLPNLRQWNISDTYQQLEGSSARRRLLFNHANIRCLGHYGNTITELHINSVSLVSCVDFARYLLAFSGLHRLHCRSVTFVRKDDSVLLLRVKERLAKKLRLLTLTVDKMPDTAVMLLLDSSQRTLQELVIDVSENTSAELRTPIVQLSQLHSITLEATISGYFDIPRVAVVPLICAILQTLGENSCSHLTDITVYFRDDKLSPLVESLQNLSKSLSQINRALEESLLRLPRLKSITLYHHARPALDWKPTVEQHLPILHERGLIKTKRLMPLIGKHEDAVTALAASPDGQWVASGSCDTTIILWDARRGAIVHEWLAHSDTVISLAFSQDCRYLASVGDDSRVTVWDISNDAGVRHVVTLAGVDACVWSSDGTMLASGSNDGFVHIWDPSTSQVQLRSIEGQPDEPLFSVVFSRDGRRIASQGNGRYSSVWDAATGDLHILPPGITTLFSRTWATFDPKGQRILIVSDGYSSRIWDIETGDELAVLAGHTHDLCDIAFSCDGGHVVSAWGDGLVRLWDSFSGDILLSFRGHEDRVSMVCFSPDGKYFASASRDQTVKLWNTSDGWCVGAFTEHDGSVEHVEFSVDGDILVSGGDDGKVCTRRLGVSVDVKGYLGA